MTPKPSPTPKIAQQYLRTKVMTSTPEQLQLMLYDGALRFGEQARVAMGEGRFDDSYNLIGRVQKIVAELLTSLKHDVMPELCGKLASLYNFAYRRLIDATVERDEAALTEAMDVLRYQRETWAMLLDKAGKKHAATAAQQIPNIPTPSSRMEASISMRG